MSADATPGMTAPVRAFLSGPLAATLDEADTGPFADNADFLRTYEALTTLQVIAYKLAAECQQRVLSFASRDFGSIYAFLEAARGEPDSISVALAEAWAEEAATAAGESFDSGAASCRRARAPALSHLTRSCREQARLARRW